jgi:hypothetical protein
MYMIEILFLFSSFNASKIIFSDQANAASLLISFISIGIFIGRDAPDTGGDYPDAESYTYDDAFSGVARSFRTAASSVF